MALTDPIQLGLESITGEISVSRQEFRVTYRERADELLDGLVSHGYVREYAGRYDLSPAGTRRMETHGTYAVNSDD
ncbi:MAG: hypothetical protein ACREO8_10180 [Luteimonas sp.]